MKKNSKLSTLLHSGATLLLACSMFVAGCKTDTPDPVPGTSTTPPGTTTTTPGTTTTTPGTTTATVVSGTAYIGSKDNLNMLEAAIARAGMSADFNKADITVFAPSDEAFKAAGFANADAINAAPVADLQRILKYHIIGSKVDLPAFPTKVNTEYQTQLADNQVSVYKVSEADISVNTAKIIQGNLPITGSVVHIINQVLKPSANDIVTVVTANNDLSLFRAAVAKADKSVLAQLSAASKTGTTIFAPNNAAFKAAGYADEAAINAADQKKLTDMLLYHVLKYRAYAQTFQNGADLVTAQGGSLHINVGTDGKVTIQGKGNGTNVANIVQADQTAANGVVMHVIDRVLLP